MSIIWFILRLATYGVLYWISVLIGLLGFWYVILKFSEADWVTASGSLIGLGVFLAASIYLQCKVISLTKKNKLKETERSGAPNPLTPPAPGDG